MKSIHEIEHEREVQRIKRQKEMDKKAKLARIGKVWVHVPSMNYRQSTGVEFRGHYMTIAEYREYRRSKKSESK